MKVNIFVSYVSHFGAQYGLIILILNPLSQIGAVPNEVNRGSVHRHGKIYMIDCMHK